MSAAVPGGPDSPRIALRRLRSWWDRTGDDRRAPMMSDSASPPALMVVMAHPDDESTSAGGVLSLYARRGMRTVLVTILSAR